MGECTTTDNACHPSKGSCEVDTKKSSSECGIAEDLMCLAKQAKRELLKEKMKVLFEAKKGKKLDKLAEIAVDAAISCMEHHVAKKEACNEFHQNLHSILKG